MNVHMSGGIQPTGWMNGTIKKIERTSDHVVTATLAVRGKFEGDTPVGRDIQGDLVLTLSPRAAEHLRFGQEIHFTISLEDRGSEA